MKPNIEKARVLTGHIQSSPADGFNGLFCLRINGLPLFCIASDGEGWQHVSVSVQGSNLPPSWAVMCKIKDLFFEDGDWVCQFHPAKSEYVNNHPGCLHLWRPTSENLPIPPNHLVGWIGKSADDIKKAAEKAIDRCRIVQPPGRPPCSEDLQSTDPCPICGNEFQCLCPTGIDLSSGCHDQDQ